MDEEEKVKAIYEKIANKNISLWCKILVKNINFEPFVEEVYCYHLWTDVFLTESWVEYNNKDFKGSIWHPVMIWRCDLLIEKWPNYFDEWIIVLDLWEDKDKPIENQNERCIDHVYNLTLVSWK